MMHVIFQVRLFAEVCIYGTMYAYIQTDRQTDRHWSRSTRLCGARHGPSSGCLHSVDWTRDWIVGLDSQKVALGDWNDTYWVCEFLVATQLSFQCEFAHDHSVYIVTRCWLWRDIWHWSLLQNSRTQGGATRLEKGAASWTISVLLPWAM